MKAFNYDRHYHYPVQKLQNVINCPKKKCLPGKFCSYNHVVRLLSHLVNHQKENEKIKLEIHLNFTDRHLCGSNIPAAWRPEAQSLIFFSPCHWSQHSEIRLFIHAFHRLTPAKWPVCHKQAFQVQWGELEINVPWIQTKSCQCITSTPSHLNKKRKQKGS